MNHKLKQEMMEWDKFFHEEDEKGNILRKCSNTSEQARHYGNQLYTKKNHDRNIHKDILLHYTKSIAFAPKDSEELALGFSNRSVLLMHLCYYEKCVIDINRAFEITKCGKLKTKLESRKEKCILLINNEMKSLKLDEDKLNISNDMVPSTKLQSAAESVDLKYHKSYGRHLIANRDIKPGEIIIAEKGYASYPDYHQIYLICSHCLSFAWNGIPCDFCVFSIYCSEACKTEAWEEYHSIECPLLKFLHYDKSICIIDVLLATRIFIKAVKAEGFDNVMKEAQSVHHSDNGLSRLLSDGILKSNKFCSCYNLHSLPDMRMNGEVGFYEFMVTLLLIKYTNITNTKSEEHVYSINDEVMMKMTNIFMKLRCIIKANGFYYQWHKCTCKNINDCQKNCETIRGLFIAPCSSLINHSCMPNVSKFFMPQRKIVLYASRPIRKGEQLCCSYGPTVTMDRISRQNYILQNFYFSCICVACKENITLKDGFGNNLDVKTVLRILSEFTKVHKVGAASPFFKDSSEKWTTFNKELLDQALTISELTYRHFENYAAFAHSIPYMIYTSQAFYNVYGEKCVMPDHC